MPNSTSQTKQSRGVVHFVPEDMDVEAPVGTPLVEIAIASGADLTFGCKKGTCGTCRVRVVNGLENLSPRSREEDDFLKALKRPIHERLACQARILGDVSIDYPETTA
jgi:ferredoxin